MALVFFSLRELVWRFGKYLNLLSWLPLTSVHLMRTFSWLPHGCMNTGDKSPNRDRRWKCSKGTFIQLNSSFALFVRAQMFLRSLPKIPARVISKFDYTDGIWISRQTARRPTCCAALPEKGWKVKSDHIDLTQLNADCQQRPPLCAENSCVTSRCLCACSWCHACPLND